MGLLICQDCLEIYSQKRNHCPNSDCKSKASDFLGVFSNFSEAEKEKKRIAELRSGGSGAKTEGSGKNIASQ